MAATRIAELIEVHYESVYRYAYRLSGSSADAEDLTQETFAKTISRIDQLREPERVRGWLFRIVRNEYLHRIRDERRNRIVPLDSIAEMSQPDSEADTLAIDPTRIQQVLNSLDETFRTPLILFYFEEFSYREIADQMDLPIGTVMSRLARAKVYLRTQLATHLDAQPSPKG